MVRGLLRRWLNGSANPIMAGITSAATASKADPTVQTGRGEAASTINPPSYSHWGRHASGVLRGAASAVRVGVVHLIFSAIFF